MLTLKGLITKDSGKQIYKTEKADYPWRKISVKVDTFDVAFPISVLPDKEYKVGQNVNLPVVIIPTQKGLANGGVVVNLKLQSVDLYEEKKK